MNEFFTDEHTAVMQKLIREIQNDPSTYRGRQYMPSTAVPARRIRTEVIEASGGLTLEHEVGTDPLYIQRTNQRVQEYEPGAYKERIRIDEKDILYLRELGQNDPSKRGIQQHIELQVDRLNRRIEAREEKLRWDAIINGGFTYLGKTFSYGVPTGNRVTPTVPWFAAGNILQNDSANPLRDLRFWLSGGTSAFRKYKFKKMVMNPNTLRVILDNTNTQSFIKTYFSSEAFGAYDINKVLEMFAPGLPPVDVYDGWYQPETVDATTGKITVGDATYFLADGYIFFECSLPDGDKIGEIVQGLQLASGSIQNPGYGKFLLVEDNTAPGTKGGPSNPYIDLVGGFYGGPKMDRPFDLLTAYVGV